MLEKARTQVLNAYGFVGECLFTSGATEALAVASARAQVERRIVFAVEHEAVLRSAGAATQVAAHSDGTINLASLDDALSQAPGRALVAVQWGNNETGVLQPIAEVAERVHAAGHLLLVDAAQMPVGWDDEHLPQLHADFVSISAHKRGGPIGTGALLVRDLATLLPSGGQERGYRGGTENVPGAVAFAAALHCPEDLPYMAELREWLDDAITGAGGVLIGDEAERRTPLIAAYRMPGVAATTQLIRFDLAGFAVSAGAACSSGSMRPSHVLAQMGIDAVTAGEVIRVSFGRETGKDDIAAFAQAWRGIAGDLGLPTTSGDLLT